MVRVDETAARFPFDPIYKAMCCHRQTLEDMLRAYVAEPAGPLRAQLVDALDFGTLRKLSMEWVTQDFHLRRGDQVWTIEFAAEAHRRGCPPFMLINLEFQSRRDGYMPLRFHQHVAELYRELRAQGTITATDPCPVLCILLHNGRSLWSAPTKASDLVKLPLALAAAPDIPRETTAFYPWGSLGLPSA